MNVVVRSMQSWAVVGTISLIGCASTPRPPHPTTTATVPSDTSVGVICGASSGVRLELRVPPERPSLYTPNRFLVTLGVGHEGSGVSGEYLFMTPGSSALPNCGVFTTPASGVLPVSIEVRDGTGSVESMRNPQARIRLDLPLKPKWIWSVLMEISPVGERKGLPAFGPPIRYMQSAKLPNGDSLFVRVSGYDPTHLVVY